MPCGCYLYGRILNSAESNNLTILAVSIRAILVFIPNISKIFADHIGLNYDQGLIAHPDIFEKHLEHHYC